MANQNLKRDISRLIQALRRGGVKVEQCGKDSVVCALDAHTNYELKVSSTDLSLEEARDIEDYRLSVCAERARRQRENDILIGTLQRMMDARSRIR